MRTRFARLSSFILPLFFLGLAGCYTPGESSQDIEAPLSSQIKISFEESFPDQHKTRIRENLEERVKKLSTENPEFKKLLTRVASKQPLLLRLCFNCSSIAGSVNADEVITISYYPDDFKNIDGDKDELEVAQLVIIEMGNIINGRESKEIKIRDFDDKTAYATAAEEHEYKSIAYIAPVYEFGRKNLGWNFDYPKSLDDYMTMVKTDYENFSGMNHFRNYEIQFVASDYTTYADLIEANLLSLEKLNEITEDDLEFVTEGMAQMEAFCQKNSDDLDMAEISFHFGASGWRQKLESLKKQQKSLNSQ